MAIMKIVFCSVNNVIINVRLVKLQAHIAYHAFYRSLLINQINVSAKMELSMILTIFVNNAPINVKLVRHLLIIV